MKRRRTSWANELPYYVITKGGKIMRIPYEEFKPIDPTRPFHTYDYATVEKLMLERLRGGKINGGT